jgi:predicted ATPase/class 3 adenylate cyclase
MASTRSTPFGELLHRARQAAGLTQEELAKQAGLSSRGISDLERGARRTPRRETVLQLAQALNLAGEERSAFEAAAQSNAAPPASDLTIDPLSSTALGESSAFSLPTGTVTFLFTDVEGSTRLLQQLGSAGYTELHAAHHRLLRAACGAHGGREVSTAGDSFFLVFPTAAQAVAAAAQVQRAVAQYLWPAGATVLIRMGLHTGTAAISDGDYVGLDVHRAARIGAAGHGGQVLLSQTTRDLALDALPEGTTLRDLGEHRLKDLQRPEHLWQLLLLDAPGLPVDFPPLAALDANRHNLPIPPTPLLGRERDVATLCTQLRRESVRLVTLTGAGGTGKTRLALQVAAELVEAFADGVWFVRLSMLIDPELVLSTIAQTLGLREAGGQPITTLLVNYLHDKHVLLVLDNFEQVVGAAPAVAGLLERCAGLNVLVTSRVALHLRGEKQYSVPPLSLPDPAHLPAPQYLAQRAAVALFIQRAQEADASFTVTNTSVVAIAAICARVDGLPLAIELAAAKVRIFSPTELLARLERRLPLLTAGARDVEGRQKTMRNTLTWSEALLSPEQQRLLWRLAVFVGGWTLDAAEAVCTTSEGAEPLGVGISEGLLALVDQSLVQRWIADGVDGTENREAGDVEARFRMLFVVREFALERLESSGEAEAMRQAHAAYFLALAEQADWRKASGRQGMWLLELLSREHDNCRAALSWACERQDGELALRLGAALATFWHLRGYWREGRTWVEELLALGAGLTSGGIEGVQRVEEVRHRWGPAAANAWAWVLAWAGIFAGNQGDLGRAVALLEETVVAARAIGEYGLAARNLQNIGGWLLEAGEVERGLSFIEEALVQAHQLESDLEQRAYVLVQAGQSLLLVPGEEAWAQALEVEGLELAQRIDLPYEEALARSGLALLALRGGDLVLAEEQAATALRVARDHDLTVLVWDFLDELAIVADREGRRERAARLLGAATKLREPAEGMPDLQLRAEIEAMMRRRATQGESEWVAAFAEGQALSVEDAVAEALEERE